MAEKNGPINWLLAGVTVVSVLVAAYAITELSTQGEVEPPEPEPKMGPVSRDMVIHEGKVGCDADPDPFVRIETDSVRFTNSMSTAATLRFDSDVEWNSAQTNEVVVPGDGGQETILVTDAISNQIPFDVIVGVEPAQCSPTGEYRPKIIIDRKR
jgi:hypothetical protein